MIRRLSTTITGVKGWIYEHRLTRYGWYLAALLGLFAFWLLSPEVEIVFVYNAF